MGGPITRAPRQSSRGLTRLRHLYLQGGQLLYYAEDTYKGSVPVRGAQIDERPPECKGRDHCFAIRHAERTFFACAASHTELGAWLDALRRAAASTMVTRADIKSAAGGSSHVQPASAAEVPDAGEANANLSRAAPPKRKPPTRGARKPATS